MVKDKILITLNRELFAEYDKVYFKNNPRARKSYFMNDWKSKKKNPKQLYSVLSLNDIIPIDQRMYNTLKEKWGNFGKYIADKYNFSEKQLTNAVVQFAIYSETRAQKDCDNVSASKMLTDGLFVQSGFFVDDSYLYINPFIVSCNYDKENPRCEIRVTVLDDNIKDEFEKIQLHIDTWKE